MSERKINLEEILNQKNLHTYYYPGGDFKKEMLHDIDCVFCRYEEEVLKAMKEACRQTLELAAENSEFYSWDSLKELQSIEQINRKSILDTINQIE